MTPAERRERWATAIHESGHIVVALAEGFSVRWVEIRKTRGRYGATKAVLPRVPPRGKTLSLKVRDDCERGARVHFAGLAAQCRLKRRVRESDVDNDVLMAERLIEPLTRSQTRIERDLWLTLLLYQSKRIIADEWPAVRRIAAALQRHGRLSGRELRRLYQQRK